MFNGRELKAINNYMRGMTQYRALTEAGYTHNTANSNPDSFFHREDVKAEIERRQKKLIEANSLSEKWIVERLMTIADADFGDLIDFDEVGNVFINYNKLDGKMRKALAGMDIEESRTGRGSHSKPVTKIKIRPADKLRALEMLMKYLGIGRDKVELSMDQELVNRLYRGRERANRQLEDGSKQTTSDTENY